MSNNYSEYRTTIFQSRDARDVWVTQCFDRGEDERGNQRQRTYTVLMDDPDPWFYEQELEDYTVLVE